MSGLNLRQLLRVSRIFKVSFIVQLLANYFILFFSTYLLYFKNLVPISVLISVLIN